MVMYEELFSSCQKVAYTRQTIASNMNITTVREALNDKKAAVMNIQVLRKLSQTSYVIGDESMVAIFEVEEAISLKEDSFVKIVKPCIKENIIQKNPKFSIIKGKVFKHNFQPKDIEAICLGYGKAEKELKLIDVETFAASKTIPSLTLKVCSISKPYNGKFSEFRNIIAKDKTSNKVTVVLYKKVKDSCELGKVYDFYKLKKTDYKGEGETNCRLSSLSETKVEEVFGKRKAQFETVSIGDDFVVGDFVGECIII